MHLNTITAVNYMIDLIVFGTIISMAVVTVSMIYDGIHQRNNEMNIRVAVATPIF